MVKGVLFDYGGTLTQSRADENILQDILITLGHAFDIEAVSRAERSFRTHWETQYSKLPRGKRWTEPVRVDCNRAALRELRLKGNLDQLAADMTRDWPAFCRPHLFDDVKPVLNTLAGLRLKMGVLSQNPQSSSQLRAELEALGIGKYFSVVLTSEDAGYDKPDPRLYRCASELVELEVSDLCHVGNDYDHDVIGARDAGIIPILLDREVQRNLRDCLVIRSLQEIPNLLSQLRNHALG